MSHKALTKVREVLPSMFDDFFKPWNGWFDGNNGFSTALTIPAVNITEEKDCYKAELAAPGMDKDDFRIDVKGDILTISAEKEEEKKENEKKYTRREYSYASFSRSFTLPNEVKKDSIDAKYSNGILQITLPKQDEAKNQEAQKIKVS
jgi:HSP20 family protein